MKPLLPFCVAVLTYSAFAQVGSGSLIVFEQTHDKFIVAADSRLTDPWGGTPPDDTYCKISTFRNKVVFASSGYLTIPAIGSFPSRDNIGIAESITASQNLKGGGYIENIADLWADEIVKDWNRIAQLSPPYFGKIMGEVKIGHFITAGIFAGVDQGEISFAVRSVYVDLARNIPTYFSPVDLPPFKLNGVQDIDIFTEFMLLTTDRAKEEKRSFTVSPSLLKRGDIETWRAVRLVDLTAAYLPSHSVGGPVDAIELWKDGSIHWVAKKPNCR